jgi:hypothetical protein
MVDSGPPWATENDGGDGFSKHSPEHHRQLGVAVAHSGEESNSNYRACEDVLKGLEDAYVHPRRVEMLASVDDARQRAPSRRYRHSTPKGNFKISSIPSSSWTIDSSLMITESWSSSRTTPWSKSHSQSTGLWWTLANGRGRNRELDGFWGKWRGGEWLGFHGGADRVFIGQGKLYSGGTAAETAQMQRQRRIQFGHESWRREIRQTQRGLYKVLSLSATSGAYLSSTRTASIGLVAVALASDKKKKLFFFLFEGVQCLGWAGVWASSWAAAGQLRSMVVHQVSSLSFCFLFCFLFFYFVIW